MKQAILNCVLVGMGGFAGAVLRYLLALLLQRQAFVLPVGTLAANLAGCFILGGVVQLAAPLLALSPGVRLLLTTGFCGGFTTMSSMVYEATQFLREGEHLHAATYLAVTVAGSFTLFLLGGLLVKVVIKSTGGIWS